jgi:hypothetical protein
MRVAIIEQTDIWQIESHGNGLAYSFYHKPDGKEAFLQGDDASQWREQYDAMRAASCNPDSVWYRKSWNECLSELCCEYVESR